MCNELESLRHRVISAFRPEDGFTFSHKLPFAYSNFIDGMAWVSILAGAAAKVNDSEISYLCDMYLICMIDAGKDARNFAPYQVKPEWIPSKILDNVWIKEKPQAFAGTAALNWAVSQGADIPQAWRIKPPTFTAKILCAIAPWFGTLIRHVPQLRQHINSVMFAHLLLNKKPPASMIFLAKDNMLYSYLYKIPCDKPYRNTGIWAAKDYPLDPPDEKTDCQYTPICELAARFLQSTL